MKKMICILCFLASYSSASAQGFVKEGSTENSSHSSEQDPYQEREKRLIAEGWVVLKEDTKPGPTEVIVNFRPGYAYTGLGRIFANGNSNLLGIMTIENGRDIYGGNMNIVTNDFITLETNDFQPLNTQTIARVVLGSDRGDIFASTLTVFERKIDFKKDVYRLLDARKNNFNDVKSSDKEKSADNYNQYNSIIGLGYNISTITETKNDFKYVLQMKFDDPQTKEFLPKLEPVLDELVADGYKESSYKNSNRDDVITLSKNGETVLNLIPLKKQRILYFEILKKK